MPIESRKWLLYNRNEYIVKDRKMKKVLGISFVIFFILSNITVVLANDLNDLYTQQNEIQTQQDAASSQLEIVKSELSVRLQQVESLNENIAKYEAEVAELNQQVETLQTSINDLNAKIQIAQENYDEKKAILDKRLIAIYENGNITYLDVLLSSKSLTEFLSNYYLISILAKSDFDFLNEIEEQKRNLEINKASLEEQQTKMNVLRKNKEKTALILENTRTLQNDYMNQLTEEEKALQAQIDEYRNQITAIENEIFQLSMQNIGSEYIGGVMAWPTPGYTRITSPYGMRTHPITGVYKLHSGVDLGAPYGSNFIAAADGVVMKAGYNTAYGNMVMVDHGGGISTLYAHGSEIMVQVGQTVKKGDVILKVGDTGYATGPHAHFEVRINGSPVNPMPYITSNQNPTDITTENTTE